MKKRLKIAFYGLMVSVVLLAGCQTESGDSVSIISPTVTGNPAVTGSGTYLHVDQEGGLGYFEYLQELGSTPQDVFFIFTNTGSSDLVTASTVSSLHSENGSIPALDISMLKSQLNDTNLETYAREHGIGLRGTPKATAFNANPPPSVSTGSGAAYQLAIPKPRYAVEGDTHTFMNESISDTIPSTLQKVVTDGTVTLNIWVANNAWGPCSKWKCLNPTMVNAFADKFLQPGSDNDIYDWVTNIFGLPWGTHAYLTELIDASHAQSIDILFFDISNDGNLTSSEPNGGILGFFWSKDNILASNTGYNFSNERLLFYMDSVLSAKETDTSWEITDEWPAEMVSTLAHEFQHMIHFYQKNVIYDVGSETWINEMASLITEDLMADKIGVNGPRGISYADVTAGSSGNTQGRLPLFNSKNYIGPTEWFAGYEALPNYSINYAFGAYLARNFGGAALFQKIVQSGETDYQAIVKAVVAQGYSETFTTLLQKWGTAVLLSDQTNLANGYRYNTGSSFSSTLNDIIYNVGSVNLFNYESYIHGYGLLSGPFLYTPATLGGHNKLSNTYVQVGTGETGSFTKTVKMAAGVKLTVVTKDTQ